MLIHVREFIPPHGRQKMTSLEIPDRYTELYQEMISSGCELQAELLNTGEVSLTVTNSDRDVDIIIVSVGPSVMEAVCQLLENANWR